MAAALPVRTPGQSLLPGSSRTAHRALDLPLVRFPWLEEGSRGRDALRERWYSSATPWPPASAASVHCRDALEPGMKVEL